MGKSKKKRNKKYTGQDARSDTNLVRVRKVNAVVRSPFKQWLHEHRKFLKRIAIIAVVVGIVVFLIVQAFIAMSN
ncbi:MAG: hypothetical protein LBQ11_02885 [Candidatus Nomurabacteria bacterium]|jgi:hypothetical protein|nr:hypothetical protein [Candidatus Nomurabacteria bacterium]